MSTPAPVRNSRVIAAGVVGNVLEWYDFAVYGYFAPIIGRHFFPMEDKTASLISAFGVFAAGFLMRPLGGLVFGHIADRVGRNPALIISVMAMAIPTFLIGLLPGYAVLGMLAPLLLVLLRMLQGLSVGGEFTTSIVYLAEAAPPNRRGFYGSWGPFGATAGVLLGSAIGSVLTSTLTEAQLQEWGWRLPFLLGLLVGIGGLLVRRHLPEPDVGNVEKPRGLPVVDAFRNEWRPIARVVALNSLLAVGFYLTFVFSVTWLVQDVGVAPEDAFDINTTSMLVLLVMTVVGGALSDRVGRRPLLLWPAVFTLVLAWPLLWLMDSDRTTLILVGQFGFAILIGLFGGTMPATMAEALPARVRCTGVSIAYNLCMGLLGGLTPMVATYLIARTDDDLSPAYVLMAACFITCIAALLTPETHWQQPVRREAES